MTTMIWDGIEFSHVDEKEAKALVKADKAQIMDGTVDGLSMKYRHEFTGYGEPEVVTPNDARDQEGLPPLPELKETKSEEPDPMTKAVQKAPMKDWRTYKKAAADDLGKPFNKTTKADVEKWWEGNSDGAV